MYRRNTWIIPAVVAAVLGIIIGILFFNGTIPVAIIATPIIFATVFAGVSLLLLFVAAAFVTKRETRECICEFGNPLIVGTVGTLVTGFIALTVISLLAAESFASALLLAFLGFFFIFAVIIFVLFVICLVNTYCYRKEDCCKFNNDYNG